jgi:polar amino acid transport system substrate-binding protein
MKVIISINDLGETNMKKKFMKVLAAAMIAGLALTGCGGSGDANQEPAGEETAMVYAVELGSAGEAAAKEQGMEYNAVNSQGDALMEVAAGTSDAAIIDLLMAGAMIGEGTSYPDMVLGDQLTEEKYGAGCRVDSDLTSFINQVMYEAQEDGTLVATAEKYGVEASLVEQPESTFAASEADSDVAYIQDKGTLVVGITEFAPMDYKDENGEWIGFDADMARLVAEKLGVECEFVVIEWDAKIMELDSKAIDVVWNGMTLNESVLEAMNCTNPYCNNAQVIVLPAAE